MNYSTSTATSQDFSTPDSIQRITERIQTRRILLPYFKKAITTVNNGKTLEENLVIFKRLSECGTYLGINNNNKILKANFCKNRLCPVCNYRKSNKQWGKIYNAILSHNEEYKYILITLTVRNCNGEELNSTINDMMSSFKRLTNRKKWKRAIKGFVRGFEITYNESLNNFHPHIHTLCAVKNEYFSDPDLYINAEELTEWWKESATLCYRPDTDIRLIDDTKKGVAEVAKYALKLADIITPTTITSARVNAVKLLYNAVSHRRLSSVGGCFRNLKLENINLTDFDNDDENIKFFHFNGSYFVEV